MWKAPNRPNKQISQTFNDGLISVYAAVDAAEKGEKPKIELIPKITLRYCERRLGIERYYKGRQNQIDISRVVRTQRREEVNNQDIAIISGVQYRIDMVQHVFDVYPECMDITLAKIEQKYKIREMTSFDMV